MSIILIKLFKVDPSISDGWSASIAKPQSGKVNKIKIASGGFTQIYLTKEFAWESILSSVEIMDFNTDDISFNNIKVNSFFEIKKLIAQLK